MFSQIEGNFVGLGIELKAEDHSLLIVHVIPGGPAAEAGMLANERIIEVDGQATNAMSSDAAADMLKGPELSYVDIVLQAPNGTHADRCACSVVVSTSPACKTSRWWIRKTASPTSS